MFLEPLGPLTSLLEAHHKGKQLEGGEAIKAVKTIVQLMGIANVNMSHLWRLRVAEDIKRALLLDVNGNHIFREVPLSFGPGFAQRGKELVKQVKAIQSTVMRKLEQRPPFSRGAPRQGDSIHSYERGGAQIYVLPTKQTLSGQRKFPAQGTKAVVEIVCPNINASTKETCKGVLSSQIACLRVVPVKLGALPAGRLREHVNTWKVIKKDPWDLVTVEGYLTTAP